MANDNTRRRRRSPAAAGDGLYKDRLSGIYQWRGTDPRDGKRIKRSTGCRRRDLARRKAAQFEEELERRSVGLEDLSNWKRELLPLAEEWLDRVGERVTPQYHHDLRRKVLLALDRLGLKRCADLTHVARIDERLRQLGKREGHSGANLRKAFQDPLKRLSRWLAENQRYLDSDPLALWAPVPREPMQKVRRCVTPEEVVRGFLALEYFDRLRERSPQRIGYLLMLICAPRPGALVSRDVEHYDRRERRLILGENVGKKRRGRAELDDATASELEAYLGDRTSGPLLLSPRGNRLRREVFLKGWRESVSLGIVDALWPKAWPADPELGALVSRALLQGVARARRGGNPLRVKRETVARWEAAERDVEERVEALRAMWSEQFNKIDCHGFRMTHRSWAEYAGVPAVLTDKQLGHAAEGEALEGLKAIRGSVTGRRFYLDTEADFFEARRSAESVRELLEKACKAVVKEGRSLFSDLAGRLSSSAG